MTFNRLRYRILHLIDALKVAYMENEIDNIRYMISYDDAMVCVKDPGIVPYMSNPVMPVHDHLWITLYGVQVWIRPEHECTYDGQTEMFTMRGKYVR